VSWGVQCTRDELTDIQPAYDRFIEETNENLGVFLRVDWLLGHGWEVVWGARIDDFSDVDGVFVSPRVALKHAVRPDLTWRMSVSSVFPGLHVFDEDLHITQVVDHSV